MPEQTLLGYFEKGFFGAVGLICTTALAAIGFHVKSDKDFRETVHKKITGSERYIINHCASKEDLEALAKAIDTRFDDLKDYIGGKNDNS